MEEFMSKKILIVDDEPHIRLLLQQALEEFEEKGVEILTANDGKQAVEIIIDQKPDLVFLDVMMPELNGFDACYKVKKDLNMQSVYIILLTAKGQEFDKKRGIEVGSDLYMTKPFDPDIVIEKASEILKI
jgi:two-component system, OmpR family, alkaline phosphatase synthesis response regulator PhoP